MEKRFLAKAQWRNDKRIGCVGKAFRPQSGKIINYFSVAGLKLGRPNDIPNCVPIAIGIARNLF